MRPGRHLAGSAAVLALLGAAALHAQIEVSRSADEVECHDFIELTVRTAPGRVKNPFVDAALTGEFVPPDGAQPSRVEGFCDVDDGSVFRIRYMPRAPGRHRYRLVLRIGGDESVQEGELTARAGSRPGILRVDREHPFHFVREPRGERWFWSSTTTYWLLGWKRDEVIRECIDRFARHRVSRIRVALNGRTTDGSRWMEPQVKSTDEFRFRLAPWPAARPDDTKNPGYDVTRFDLDHFRKCERMLRHARDRDVIVSIIFHLDGRDPGVDPFGKERMGGPDEQRYYRYVVARLAAFSNVMWDITNEWTSSATRPGWTGWALS